MPKEVKATITESVVTLEGPKGKLSLDLPYGIKVEQKENQLVINRLNDAKQSRANHGTIRARLAQIITGVTKGHKKSLEIQGVGYRAQLKGKTVEFNLGLSHSVQFPVPEGVTVTIPQPTEIHLEGVDNVFVGQIAAKMRALKRPEPYKGKGIRYSGEVVRRKQGKSITK